jgi:hypothetical protein
MRLMVDSISPDILPTNVGLVAGYVNGSRSQWPHNAWDRFPNSHHVRVNVIGTPTRGDCLDIETGDATPDHAPTWYDSINWTNKDNLIIYTNRSQVAAVSAAMGKRPWRLWLATLDGTAPTIWEGKAVTAVQYLGSQHLGMNMDMSLVFDDNWLKVH